MSVKRFLILPALALALLLAGCSDDGDSDAASPVDAPEQQSECEADVKLTGKEKVEWSGAATVLTGGGNPTIYSVRSEPAEGGEDPAVLTVFAETAEGEAYAAVSVGDRNYTVQPGSDGLDVDPDGDGASVDSEATGQKKSVRVVADITCD